jgi:poly-gamma-glutamate capsule biosynthesis protein CapA/YwtB (metallophosphatase superfamily)
MIMRCLLFFLFLSLSSPGDTIKLLFMGDVMSHGKQLAAAHIQGRDTLLDSSYDYSSYFKYTSEKIKEADFAVANVEHPSGLAPFSGYPSFSGPLSLVEEAKRSGVDLVLCANNHITDKGIKGVQSTINGLQSVGIPFTGVYQNSEEENELNPYLTTIGGIKIAFINFTYGLNNQTPIVPFVVNFMDTVSVKKAIDRAKQRKADIIVALPHWGEEYILSESSSQRRWRDFLLREGVSLIIGTHPHVIQPVEIAREGDHIKSITVYSLGNYISNMSLTNTPMGIIYTVSLTTDEKGEAVIVDGISDWIWCSRAGKLDNNYTTVFVTDFLDRKSDFKDQNDYKKMSDTYYNLKSVFDNGK